MRQLLWLLAGGLLTTEACAQENTWKKFLRLSRPEKCWVLFHPFIAKKALTLSQRAMAVGDAMKKDTALDGLESGGQVDAFRHAYWMALLAQHIQPKKACSLGLAHEKGNKQAFKKHQMEEGILPDSVSAVMDMENNSRGVSIGCEHPELDEEELKKLVKEEVLKGSLKIILKDSYGNFLDCGGKVIPMDLWKGKWNIPKCLVSSSYRYSH